MKSTIKSSNELQYLVYFCNFINFTAKHFNKLKITSMAHLI